MGSHTATYAAVALAIALVSLLAGFFWGRSNVKSQIEAALEKASVSLDAREFAMRQQLDEAFAEVARLRPLAEELGGVQERLKREQSKFSRMRAEFGATNAAEVVNEPEPEPDPADSADEAIQKLLQSLEVFNAPSGQTAVAPEALVAPPPPKIEPVIQQAPPKAAPIAQPALRAAAPPPPPASPKPARSPQPAAIRPPAEPQRREQPRPAPPPSPKAAPAEPRKIAPAPPSKPVPAATKTPGPQPRPGQKVDEWQEFARQLEALTGKKK